MKQYLIAAIGFGVLSACGGGDDGNEVDTMVEQHRIMVKNACVAEGETESKCTCISNVLKDQLDTPLFISASNAIGKGESPSKWLETVPEAEREAARAAMMLARDCPD